MIGKLNHIAVAVPNLKTAKDLYEEGMGAIVSEEQSLPDHGVTVVFVELPNTKIELLHPLGENSPIQRFLDNNPDGGVHHICYEVKNLIDSRDRLRARGARVLGTGEPQIGAHEKPVVFLHPKDFCGTLIELEEA